MGTDSERRHIIMWQAMDKQETWPGRGEIITTLSTGRVGPGPACFDWPLARPSGAGPPLAGPRPRAMGSGQLIQATRLEYKTKNKVQKKIDRLIRLVIGCGGASQGSCTALGVSLVDVQVSRTTFSRCVSVAKKGRVV